MRIVGLFYHLSVENGIILYFEEGYNGVRKM